MVAAAGPVLGAGSADASTYRYWTYWWGSGTGKAGTGWTFAPAGPGYHVVGDTAVVGWRFATTSTVGGAKPRQSADFAALCPQLASPVSGSVRVALVVDYGTGADAPPGQSPPTTSTVRVECLTLPVTPKPTGNTALGTAGIPTRVEQGLVCALDGYPVGECAPVVADPSPTTGSSSPPATAKPSPTPTRSQSPSAPRSSASPAPATAGAAASPTGPATPSASGPTTSGAASATGTPADAVAPTGPVPSSSPAPGSDTSGPATETLPAVSGAPVAAGGAAEQPTSPVGFALGALVIAGIGAAAWWTTTRGGRAS